MDNVHNKRLTPEELLNVIARKEKQRGKGKLKIFLGMAAGVGKTYSMLEESHFLKKNGVDVVIGIIDTHGRKETGLLAEGLPSIPPQKISYKTKIFEELDLDAVLQRQPQLVLIDELAHSNIPGARHLKRWEDVLEILDAGIDVYATLNIQHVESLKDIIESVADVPIRETVPDLLFNSLTSVQFVDIEPAELLVRLHEGKVYLGAQSQIAARNFFQKERLTALREIALRYVAEIVDSNLRDMIPVAKGTTGPWQSREKIMVAISHHPHSQQLIRTARRLAFNLDLPWIALHVEDNSNPTESESAMLAKNIALARDLGAEYISTNDKDIPSGISRIAHQQNVTLIVVGRPHKSFFIPNRYKIFERISKECRDLDIFVVREEASAAPMRRPALKSVESGTGPFHYASGALAMLPIACLNWLLLPFIGYKLCGLLFLLGIILLSLFFRKGPLLFAAGFAALVWGGLFASHTALATEDFALIAVYMMTAGIAGVLGDRGREQTQLLLRQEATSQTLYEIVHHILKDSPPKTTLVDIQISLEKALEGVCEIIVSDINGDLAKESTSFTLLPDEKEINAAIWVLGNGKEAGLSTSTLPQSKNFYAPILGIDSSPLGAILYRPKSAQLPTSEEKNLLCVAAQQLSFYASRHLSQKEHLRSMQTKEFESKIVDVG